MINEEKVREALDRIRRRDQDLGGELDAKLKPGVQTEAQRQIFREAFGGQEARPAKPQLTKETIVLATGRPVLGISGNEAQLKFDDAESEVWRERLKRAGALLTKVIKAVGRIDVEHHPSLDWLGTGWLVRPDVIVTNRHVAKEFGRRSGEGFVFRGGTGGQRMSKKRLAPGQITAVASDLLQHDCSTLGGNSGSVVLDLTSGEAVGIHFAGRFLEANFAVPADQILERVSRIDRREKPTGRMLLQSSGGGEPERDPQMQNPRAVDGVCSVTCTIPIRVTLEVGSPYQGEPRVNSMSVVGRTPATHRGAEDGDEDVILTEAVPEDYRERLGYRPDFLGEGTDIRMPTITRAADQIVTFAFAGNAEETELRYQHFSVVMHRYRRLCFFSAVNVAGAQSRKVKRPGWRRDPRIPNDLQILGECYGDAPKFSRGHMTRREDPVWGDDHDAVQGNADSMHVTNTVPQMQTFNAGIWLGLEDYALDHARDDEMRISVITGPVLLDGDPVRYGVRIPRTFWKVIAFIHEKTGKLSATGYSISQDKFLKEEEFVFGAYETHQRSLAWIERKAGVSFGSLTAVDRFEDSEEAIAAPLADFRQIRFF